MYSKYHIKLSFSRPRKWSLSSWLVRRIMGTKFSHVRLEVNEAKSTKVIVSHSSAFNSLHVKNYNTHNILYTKRFDIDKAKYDAISKYCTENIDNNRSVFIVIKLLLLLTIGLLNRRDSKLFICSNYIIKTLKSLKLCLNTTFNINMESMTPHELYVLVRKL